MIRTMQKVDPDFYSARRYALGRLERELPANLVYHNFHHTAHVVFPAARWLCDQEGVGREDRMLALTAALFHDLGYLVRMEDHEQMSALIAAQVLPAFGYKSPQVERILRLILSTHLPHHPADRLEEILVDADLDVLGRRDFSRQNAALRAERANLGQSCTDIEWLTEQLAFMQSHSYFTRSERLRRDRSKAANMDRVASRLARLRSGFA